MPIYEYRCPNGHTFEVFQRMADPPVPVCEVCGAGPVEKLLFPVAVHFKGKGFYSTDYGRGSGARTGGGKEGEPSSSSGSDGSAPEKSSSSDKKPAGDGGTGSSSKSSD